MLEAAPEPTMHIFLQIITNQKAQLQNMDSSFLKSPYLRRPNVYMQRFVWFFSKKWTKSRFIMYG